MIINIKSKFFLALFIFFSSPSIADSWISPVEMKYKNAYPILYSKYDKAKTLLSDYRGNSSELVEAQTLLNEVIGSMKSFAPAYREYGRLIVKAGHIRAGNFQGNALEASESLLLESIKLEPDYADAYVFLGYVYIQMRDYDRAREALTKAEKIGTGLAWLNYNWAELLRKEDKNEEAIKRYKAVIDSNTDNKAAYSSALSSIANLYMWAGDNENAKIWYEKNVQYEPESAWNWGGYGEFLLFYYGDVDDAIVKLEKALSIMNYGVARTHYACALYTKWAAMYKKDSNDPEANALYKKASEIEPDLDVIYGETSRYETTRETAELIKQRKIDKHKKEIEEMIKASRKKYLGE